MRVRFGECMLDSAIRVSSLLREMRQTLKGSATASDSSGQESIPLKRQLGSEAEFLAGAGLYGQVAKAFVSWIGSKGVPCGLV